MARLWTSGAELGIAVSDFAASDLAGFAPDGKLSGTTFPTIDTTTFRSGARSWKCRGAAATSYNALIGLGPLTVAARTYYAREYCLWTATETPQVGTQLLVMFATGSSTHWAAIQVASVVGSALTLALYADTGKLDDIAGTYVANAWHRIEMSMRVDNSLQIVVDVQINGISALVNGIRTISTANASTTGPTQVSFGKVDSATTASLWIDDLALNDDQGANQNTWPGDGKVVLLLPTADSAIGTGWTLGTGTAISGNTGKTAVANTPPLGVADLAVGSDVKQIRNATSNANVNYDATMTTYTAAGIGANDVITVIDPFVSTAAPVVTSAKAGTVGVVSNPAITNIALSATGTAGAFWANAAAAAWPTGWKWSHGTMTYNPSVTKSTSPVMRVTQVTASTRIAMVAAMGIYVEYVPAVVKPKRYFSRANQTAVMRAAAR